MQLEKDQDKMPDDYCSRYNHNYIEEYALHCNIN